MKTQNIRVKLRDGEMGAYLAIPDRTPAGAIIAIMEIWGVNDTMRRHAHEFAQAGFICLVPDLFWRQEPGVELSDHDPDHVEKAFGLYYDFDYDLAVRDMEDTEQRLHEMREIRMERGFSGSPAYQDCAYSQRPVSRRRCPHVWPPPTPRRCVQRRSSFRPFKPRPCSLLARRRRLLGSRPVLSLPGRRGSQIRRHGDGGLAR
jgi:hypothetical protein